MANKQQRLLNRWVRKYNKALAQDTFLGLNRFTVKQEYKVGRDYETLYIFRVVDNATQEVSREIVADEFNFRQKIFWASNDFIVAIRQKEKW